MSTTLIFSNINNNNVNDVSQSLLGVIGGEVGRLSVVGVIACVLLWLRLD